MPVQTSPPSFPDSFPSFMSVYGGLPPQYEEESSCHLQASAHFSSRRLRPHRESISSTASASTESSPTTTISPFDSPLGGDIPNSSPEFILGHVLVLSRIGAPCRASKLLRVRQRPDSSRLRSAPQVRPDSPNRRARNLKNLSLRMPPPQSRDPQLPPHLWWRHRQNIFLPHHLRSRSPQELPAATREPHHPNPHSQQILHWNPTLYPQLRLAWTAFLTTCRVIAFTCFDRLAFVCSARWHATSSAHVAP